LIGLADIINASCTPQEVLLWHGLAKYVDVRSQKSTRCVREASYKLFMLFLEGEKQQFLLSHKPQTQNHEDKGNVYVFQLDWIKKAASNSLKHYFARNRKFKMTAAKSVAHSSSS
jgi:hypothetical protein